MYSITMLSLYFSFYSSFFLRLSPSSFLSPLCVSLSLSLTFSPSTSSSSSSFRA